MSLLVMDGIIVSLMQSVLNPCWSSRILHLSACDPLFSSLCSVILAAGANNNGDGSRPRSGDVSRKEAAESAGDVDFRTRDLRARTSGGASATGALSGEGADRFG